MAGAVAKLPAWRLALTRWAYNHSYFREIGLMRDDTLHETEEVKEALSRLPRDILGERQFRISRAFSLSTRKEVLPKAEWTQIENDVQYLQPYLQQVIKEKQERDQWNKQ